MRCPRLSDLPPPPPGKTGWPWTVESPQLPDVMPDGVAWPRITIVTPNYNQGQFLEEAIRSVLLQGYPNLEYMIIDGGSTDASVEVVKKYDAWLSHWVSERDRGQSHAINKGFHRSTGEIFQWINADDLLVEGALGVIAAHCPRDGAFAGVAETFGDGYDLGWIRNRNLTVQGMLRMKLEFCQQGLWLSRAAAHTCLPLDEGLHYAFDAKMLSDLVVSGVPIVESGLLVARFRLHPDSKTVGQADGWLAEREQNYNYLLSNEKFLPYRNAILRRRRRTSARSAILAAKQLGRSRVVLTFFKTVSRNPSLAFDRFLLGALRRSLFSCGGMSPTEHSQRVRPPAGES